jgi:uncharacterized protein YegJ (DUF2314 family)
MKRPGPKTVVAVEAEDTEMTSAMAEARRRFPAFRRALEKDWRRIIPVINRSLVKARFRSAANGKAEHMWIEVSNFEADKVVGELANQPQDIPELSKGARVIVSCAEISDWVYWVGDKVVGGFTLAVLQRREKK